MADEQIIQSEGQRRGRDIAQAIAELVEDGLGLSNIGTVIGLLQQVTPDDFSGIRIRGSEIKNDFWSQMAGRIADAAGAQEEVIAQLDRTLSNVDDGYAVVGIELTNLRLLLSHTLPERYADRRYIGDALNLFNQYFPEGEEVDIVKLASGVSHIRSTLEAGWQEKLDKFGALIDEKSGSLSATHIAENIFKSEHRIKDTRSDTGIIVKNLKSTDAGETLVNRIIDTSRVAQPFLPKLIELLEEVDRQPNFMHKAQVREALGLALAARDAIATDLPKTGRELVSDMVRIIEQADAIDERWCITPQKIDSLLTLLEQVLPGDYSGFTYSNTCKTLGVWKDLQGRAEDAVTLTGVKINDERIASSGHGVMGELEEAQAKMGRFIALLDEKQGDPHANIIAQYIREPGGPRVGGRNAQQVLSNLERMQPGPKPLNMITGADGVERPFYEQMEVILRAALEKPAGLGSTTVEQIQKSLRVLSEKRKHGAELVPLEGTARGPKPEPGTAHAAVKAPKRGLELK